MYELFLSRCSLIIVRSEGPRWAKLGVSDNPWICSDTLGYRCGRKIAPKSSGGALGAPQEAFLAASVADRLPHTFQEASGVYFGATLTSEMLVVLSCVGPVARLVGAFFLSMFATRAL